MEQIQKVRKCYTCGATLQSEDPDKEGYINPEVLENPTQNFAFCQKCFEAERYSALSNEPFILNISKIVFLNSEICSLYFSHLIFTSQ